MAQLIDGLANQQVINYLLMHEVDTFDKALELARNAETMLLPNTSKSRKMIAVVESAPRPPSPARQAGETRVPPRPRPDQQNRPQERRVRFSAPSPVQARRPQSEPRNFQGARVPPGPYNARERVPNQGRRDSGTRVQGNCTWCRKPGSLHTAQECRQRLRDQNLCFICQRSQCSAATCPQREVPPSVGVLHVQSDPSTRAPTPPLIEESFLPLWTGN